jgi:CRP/FNR family transcriptional regulator
LTKLAPFLICAVTKVRKKQMMAKSWKDVELVMVPLHLMDKWMMQHHLAGTGCY